MAESDKVKARMMGAAEDWAHQVGNHLAGEGARLAPVDEGTLRGSTVVDVSVSSTSVEVAVEFPLVYAEAQHEGIDFAHPKGGQAKFLEEPLKANLSRYEAALGAAVGKAL